MNSRRRSSPVMAPPSFVATIFLRITSALSATAVRRARRDRSREARRTLSAPPGGDDLRHQVGHLPEHGVHLHGGVELRFAIRGGEGRARVEPTCTLVS